MTTSTTPAPEFDEKLFQKEFGVLEEGDLGGFSKNDLMNAYLIFLNAFSLREIPTPQTLHDVNCALHAATLLKKNYGNLKSKADTVGCITAMEAGLNRYLSLATPELFEEYKKQEKEKKN